jgi:hypothetical protein
VSLNLVLVCDRCSTQVKQTSDLSLPLGQISRLEAQSEGWKISAQNVGSYPGSGFSDFCDECYDSFLCSPLGDVEYDRITAERAAK